jgi:FkbM family methyltransferase
MSCQPERERESSVPQLTGREQNVYDWLQDDESRELFLVRKRHTELGLSIYDTLNGCGECEKLAELLRNHKFVIYGVGNSGRCLAAFATERGLQGNYVAVWDNDTAKSGAKFLDRSVSEPDAALSGYDLIIITPTWQKHYNEMRDKLRSLNIGTQKVYWLRPPLEQYFDEAVILSRLAENEVFIDGGCFDFETSAILLSKAPSVKRIYAFEPNRLMIPYIEAETAKLQSDIVRLEVAAIWSKKTELFFDVNDNQVNKARSYLTDDGKERVAARSIQNVVDPNDKVTFIKLDIEGAELEGLRGAEEIIKRDKPKLAVCIYHKPEDYVEIAEYIKAIVPEYKAYIRQYFYLGAETVLYCVI